MRARCDNKSHPQYKDYGGRGITYDPRWKNFTLFLEDMGERPANTELERELNNGLYCKDNCKWVTHKENARNRRNAVYASYKGQQLLVIEWAELYGIPYKTLHARLQRGWSITEAIEVPLGQRRLRQRV
jgi:hypothetical protein